MLNSATLRIEAMVMCMCRACRSDRVESEWQMR